MKASEHLCFVQIVYKVTAPGNTLKEIDTKKAICPIAKYLSRKASFRGSDLHLNFEATAR